jgi:hypothetical protein
MRATRDLLRRRTPLRRPRAALVAHGQTTNAQYKLPDIGKESAAKAHREGVAGRFPAGAVHKPIEVDLALRTSADALLSALALSILPTAKQHDAPPLSLRQPGPGIGTILRRVRRDARHDIDRVPRGQNVAADGRLVKGAQASAGKRWGTSGQKIGNAPRPGAASETAPLCLRTNANGQKLLTRVAKTHGKGKALSILAHNLTRAVYPRRTRHPACDMESCVRPSRSRAGEPGASLAPYGRRLPSARGKPWWAASVNAQVCLGRVCRSPHPCWDARAGAGSDDDRRPRLLWAAPPPHLARTGERGPFSPACAEDGLRGHHDC